MKNTDNNVLLSLLEHDPNDLNYKKVEFKMRVAANIDDQMKVKGIGKKKLAYKMNVSPSMVTRWLSGHHNFTLNTLVEIAHTLDITVHKLVAEKEKEKQISSAYIFTVAC